MTPEQRSNPFPATAVAAFSGEPFGEPTVPTSAVTRARSLIDTYTRTGRINNDNGSNRGNVIAIVGDYGTGKTHLALDLLSYLRRETPVDMTRTLYIEAPADTFLALYRQRFVAKLTRSDVRRRVSDLYSHIVASALDTSALTAPVAQALRAGNVDPSFVVQDLGLPESAFKESLYKHLHKVTARQDFATALTLFLRPEFEPTVWDWLAGNEPDGALIERGITRTIASDPEALEAIGVFALLYADDARRFVLVIDEVEKILSPGQRSAVGDEIVAALKRLLELIGRTDALLVLCGLPDFLEALPEDARQRISEVIRPTRLSADDTIRYIEDVQELATGDRELRPFNPDVAHYLAELAGGNARQVIRLCYYAYAAALAAGSDVTRAIVREVARDRFELVTLADLRADVVRVIDRHGWHFARDAELPGRLKGSSIRVDYWIPTGDEGAGCAIVLTQSVLQQDVADELVARAQQVIGGARQPARVALVVVNGYLGHAFSEMLGSAFTRVVVHDLSRFVDDLDAALVGLVQRLEGEKQQATLGKITERLDRITRQNAHVDATLAEIARSMGGQASVERAVTDGLAEFFGRLSRGAEPRGARQFPGVHAIFEEASVPLRRLEGIVDQQVSNWRKGWGEETLVEPFVGRRGEAVAEALKLSRLIGAFRDEVLALLDSRADARASERPRPDWEEELESLCRNFDEILVHTDPGRTIVADLPEWPAASYWMDLRELPRRIYSAALEDFRTAARR